MPKALGECRTALRTGDIQCLINSQGQAFGVVRIEQSVLEWIACQSIVGMSEAVDVVTALSVRATESKSCIDSKTPPLGKNGSYAKDLNHLEEPCCIRPEFMGWVQ